jgi:type IV fimbrial biogenesis protein FimT
LVILSRRQSVRRVAGFTLVELMVGVLVVSVLMTIGVPSFRDFILKQRLRTTGTDLRIALMTARSEAIKRNAAVSLKPSASPSGWGAGWTIDPGVLDHKQTGDATITKNPTGTVTFTPSGRVMTVSKFQIDVGPDSANDKSCLTLGLDGRTSSVAGACL